MIHLRANTNFDDQQSFLFVSGIRQSSWNFADPGVHTTFTPGRESPIAETYTSRKIRLVESSAKCLHLKKFTCKGIFAAGVYLTEAPCPPRLLFGVVKQFWRF
jgi:hypothetical protein